MRETGLKLEDIYTLENSPDVKRFLLTHRLNILWVEIFDKRERKWNNEE